MTIIKIDLDAIKTLDRDAVFSVFETARLLGMTHNGVLNRIKKGQIKAGKTGCRYFILGAEIQKQVVMPEEHDI